MNIHGKITSALLATLMLAACGGSALSGTYTDPMGVTSYTFKSGGVVDVGAMGVTTEMHYEIDGNQVKVGVKDGPMQVMTLEKDGSISGPMGVKLTRKK